jgi:flagellar biosynthesis anti-sigma factor FlgM
MRIDLYNSTASELASEQTSLKNSQNAATSGAPGPQDRATLSSDTTAIGSLVSTAMSSPELRQQTIESLKQAIGSGQYQLDPQAIAASMVDDHA